jgi:hypothetical protein
MYSRRHCMADSARLEFDEKTTPVGVLVDCEHADTARAAGVFDERQGQELHNAREQQRRGSSMGTNRAVPIGGPSDQPEEEQPQKGYEDVHHHVVERKITKSLRTALCAIGMEWCENALVKVGIHTRATFMSIPTPDEFPAELSRAIRCDLASHARALAAAEAGRAEYPFSRGMVVEVSVEADTRARDKADRAFLQRSAFGGLRKMPDTVLLM